MKSSLFLFKRHKGETIEKERETDPHSEKENRSERKNELKQVFQFLGSGLKNWSAGRLLANIPVSVNFMLRF